MNGNRSLPLRGHRLGVVVALAITMTMMSPSAGGAGFARFSPNPSATLNTLNGVAGVSSTDAWAVGWYEHNRTGIRNSLAMHWEGTRWARVWTPNGSAPGTSLEAVSAVSTDDAWAVGVFHRRVTGQRDLPLALHWDGAAWTRVWTPRPVEGATLADVVALAADDVWAVGSTRTIPERSLTLHWDGKRWTRVWSPSAASGDRTFIRGVGGIASDDVWAVGGCWGAPYSIALHWDGTRWTRSNATFVKTGGRLEAVVSRTTTDAWAVGGYGFLRWDGSTWSPIGPEANLYGVDVLPSGEAWAVGKKDIFRWDGLTWPRVWSDPTRPLGFEDVSAVSPDDVWAVGWEYDFSGDSRRLRTFILHWDGTAWSRT